MREFHAQGAVASESLIRALQRDRDGWAESVLGQCFGIPKEYRDALLAGEAEWQILNPNTIIIGLVKNSSL
jgi:hypothetical protein